MAPHPLSDEEMRLLGARRVTLALDRADTLYLARAHVRALASGALVRRRLNDALVLTSELITNSLLHAGGGAITLWAGLDERRLRVEVHDQGDGLPDDLAPALPTRADERGCGLYVVQLLADRWDHRRAPWPVVWFEIDS